MRRLPRVCMPTSAHVLLVLALLMLTVALCLYPPTTHADTPVGGAIASDTTWTLAYSPYLVVQSVDVWEGVTLTIEPGVVVKFGSDQGMQINGTLVARGTATERITFTSSEASPEPGDYWGNIHFTDTSTDATFTIGGVYTAGSILQYCTVEYAICSGDALGAIETQSASPFIDSCIVRDNGCTGIFGTGSEAIPVVISRNAASGNGATAFSGGIHATYGMVIGNTVSDNRVFDGAGGIYALHTTVMSNTVSGNMSAFTSGGIHAKNSTVTGNAVIGNSSHSCGGVFARHSTLSGNNVATNSATWKAGGIEAHESTVTDNIVRGNSAGGNHGGGIEAYSSTVMSNTVSSNSSTGHGGGISAVDSTLTGNIVYGNSSDDVGGGIYALDSALTGNVIYGSSSADHGGGIYALDSAVVGSTIIANSVSAQGQGAGLYASGSENVLNNTVIGNYGPANAAIGGVAMIGAPPFHHNNLYGNEPYDVLILSTQDISGTNNYWGAASNDDIQEQVYDWYDDGLRGRLLLTPFLEDPDPLAPVPPPLNLAGDWHDGSVSLEWDPVPSTAATYGYKVYYDSDRAGPPYDGTGLDQGDSAVDVSNQTAYTLTGLTELTPYYIAVTAYETLGRAGWYSNEVNNLSMFAHYIHLPLIVKQY